MSSVPTCSICLDSNDGEFWTPACNHGVHPRCIIGHINANLSNENCMRCPACRMPFDNADMARLAHTTDDFLPVDVICCDESMELCEDRNNYDVFRCDICRKLVYAMNLPPRPLCPPRCLVHGRRTMRIHLVRPFVRISFACMQERGIKIEACGDENGSPGALVMSEWRSTDVTMQDEAGDTDDTPSVHSRDEADDSRGAPLDSQNVTMQATVARGPRLDNAAPLESEPERKRRRL